MSNEKIKLQAYRRMMRCAAAGGILFGALHLGAGLIINYDIRENPPHIDTSSEFNYSVTSQPQNYAIALEGSGLLGLGLAGAAVYESRRTTKKLRKLD